MSEQKYTRLNQLDRDLPEGLLVDAAWLTENGYSTPLRVKYVQSGRLEQPARSVYRRPRGTLTWQQVVISLQTLLGRRLTIGGRTALELQGYVHYLTPSQRDVHLYGETLPPNWLSKLSIGTEFLFHNAERLFSKAPQEALPAIGLDGSKVYLSRDAETHFLVQTWGQWDWPMILSTPEQALLELLDELPNRESFHQVDMFVEGLVNLRPGRLEKLLKDCTSVKVKRLFFFFADRHHHAWAKRLKPSEFDLGQGKRMLVRNGRLDKRYLITVPEDFDGVQ